MSKRGSKDKTGDDKEKHEQKEQVKRNLQDPLSC
jgi:hypothetical protein